MTGPRYEDFWEAAAAGERPTSEDFEWFAIDSQNLIAMLTTAGDGSILQNTFRDLDTHIKVRDLFTNLPCIGNAEILENEGTVDDWRVMAERGLYGFDFRNWQRKGGYYLVARPEKTLHIEDIPMWAQEWLEGLRIENVSFETSSFIKESLLAARSKKSEWL